jgi:phosphoserine phosphatase
MNSSTKLILQGPGADSDTVNRIAAIVHAKKITPIGPQAFRCDDIDSSNALRSEVAAACHPARMDGTFMDASRQLSDFRVLVMDMDSTLITIECIDEIADMQGLKTEVAAITEAAMRGELDFRESLIRRVALLKGLDASALHQVFEERLRLSPGADSLLQGIKAAGLRSVLVSGGFTYFTDRLKTLLALDTTRANLLEVVDGKLTGHVIGHIIDAEAKRQTVIDECTALGTSSAAAIVIGDGANDLAMMSIAGLSVAFRAKPVVQAKAHVTLNYAGLDGVLNLFR